MAQGPPDPVYVLRGCQSAVTTLLFTHPRSEMQTPSEARLLSGTQNGRVEMWDLKLWRSIYQADVHSNSVLSLYENPYKPGLVFSQGRDGLIKHIDLQHQSASNNDQIVSPALGFCPICWTNMGNKQVVVIPNENKSQLDIFSVEDGDKVISLIPKSGPLAYGMCMCIRALNKKDNTEYIVVGYEDGSISVWDLRTAKEVDHDRVHSESVMAMDYHPATSKGVSGSANEELYSWTISDRQTIDKMTPQTLTNPGIACVNFREDGKFFVTGGWDGKVRAFGAKKCKPLAVLDHHQETVQCTAFSPEGLLAAGGKDCHISFWSIYS